MKSDCYALFDLAQWKNGLAFKKIDFSSDGEPVIKIAELKNGITGQTQFTEGDYGDEVHLTKGDMLFSWSGNPETSIDVFWYNLPDGWLNQHIFKVIPKPFVDRNFLYYLLKSLKATFTAIASNKQTTGLGHITLKDLKKLNIALPSEKEQKIIGRYLYTIDQKISVNQAINDNLAEILQTLYQQQFCYSKGTGNQGRLADLCDYSKTKVAVAELSLSTYYSTENMLPGKAGAVDAASLPTTAQATKCQIGDVLISNIRPYFKKIVYCHSDCGCSADVLCFTPKVSQLSAYLYSTLYVDSFFDFMVAGSKGTKMPRGDKQQIMAYVIHIPTEEEIRTFNKLAIPILGQMESTHRENMRLSSLRDSLLPKLMSGELDVSELDI
mgnify:CR=1 FL=1